MSELKDLVGLHMLDAVDFETLTVPAYEGADYNEDVRSCRFRLGGTMWAAVEDPNDGYRSSMRDLVHSPDVAAVNSFPAVQVLAIYRDKHDYNSADILELYDTHTGKMVLSVGTDSTDDYYPSFVANFQPENMVTNAGAKADPTQ